MKLSIIAEIRSRYRRFREKETPAKTSKTEDDRQSTSGDSEIRGPGFVTPQSVHTDSGDVVPYGVVTVWPNETRQGKKSANFPEEIVSAKTGRLPQMVFVSFRRGETGWVSLDDDLEDGTGYWRAKLIQLSRQSDGLPPEPDLDETMQAAAANAQPQVDESSDWMIHTYPLASRDLVFPRFRQHVSRSFGRPLRETSALMVWRALWFDGPGEFLGCKVEKEDALKARGGANQGYVGLIRSGGTDYVVHGDENTIACAEPFETTKASTPMVMMRGWTGRVPIKHIPAVDIAVGRAKTLVAEEAGCDVSALLTAQFYIVIWPDGCAGVGHVSNHASNPTAGWICFLETDEGVEWRVQGSDDRWNVVDDRDPTCEPLGLGVVPTEVVDKRAAGAKPSMPPCGRR